jgi:H+-transporting ATPase
MTPLGWGWAGFVWGYALIWFLLNDRLKLLAYKIFDSVKAKTPSDLEPQIAKRAYELYEKGGRKDGRAVQDWKNAEQEIMQTKDKTQPEPKSETKPDSKSEAKPDAKDEAKPYAKSEAKPDAKDEAKPDAKSVAKPDSKSVAKPDSKDEAKPDSKDETVSNLTPQIVKRVHELYEELGREDVRAVEDLEKKKKDVQKDAPDK